MKIVPLAKTIFCGLLCVVGTTAFGGVSFANLFYFSGTNGIEPEGQLLQVLDGDLYGTL